MRGMGRKSTYTETIADEICERIANGEPLRQICRDDHMPGWVTVYTWIKTYPQFAERFARARDLGADAIAESCLEIADDATNDWMVANGQSSEAYKLNGEHIQRSKLRVETRLKLLAKWSPKKYGDSQKLEMSGGLQLTGMSNEDLEAEIAALSAQIAHSALPEHPAMPEPEQADEGDDVSDLL